MSTKYTKHFNTKKTSQSDPVPGKDQVRNNAGGYTFALDKFQQLNRFLILGSTGGTYYVGEKPHTVQNADTVVECIKEDGPRVVNTIVDCSTSGRAVKNDPAIFALALCCTFGDQETKNVAYKAITDVCRTGTHLFQFVDSVKDLRGWSRGLRNGVGQLYLGRTDDQLAYQVVKYRQRNGWTHRDVLRLVHQTPQTLNQEKILGWAAGKVDDGNQNVSSLIEGFEKIQALDKSDVKQAVSLIQQYNLPREAVPTEFLNSKEVWEAMLPKMPITALIRNLGKMTSAGVLDSNLSDNVKLVCEKVTNRNALSKGRVHPFTVLNALRTYQSGAGFRGKLTWSPVQKIVDALDDAFYMAFDNVEPTGKNFFLGVDCSGSMNSRLFNSNVSCREAAAAMAMVALKTEENSEITGFSAGNSGRGPFWMRRNNQQSLDGIEKLPVSPKMRLDQVAKVMQDFHWGGTDCALPMLYAKEHKLPVDVFTVYTDNETWAGDIHPYQALNDYRQAMGRDAKLVVVGMTATNFSIADPNDGGMLDIVGFDTSAPEIMAQFARGQV